MSEENIRGSWSFSIAWPSFLGLIPCFIRKRLRLKLEINIPTSIPAQNTITIRSINCIVVISFGSK